MKDSSRRAFLKGGSALGVAVLAGCAAPTIEAREEETRVVSPAGFDALEIRNINGSVTVEPWAGDDVEVRIIKQGFFTEDLDSAEVDIGGSDTLTIARIVRDEEPGLVVVSFDVRVPAAFPVTHASTSNGFVDIRGTVGDLEVRATNGKIDVRDIDGFVSLATSNGKVTAFDIGGMDGARTTNGGIEVDVPAIRGDTAIESSNGEITTALAGDLNAELVAQTSTGSVDVSRLSLSESTVSRTRVTGTLGTGGPTLTVSTTNGNIELSLLSE
ncbi:MULTISPECIES: DUF4097 family beta strand repeat-containing protein [Haloferax]|uniref:DUF4097 family beta strand repeat protein n=2 Tax=Haloferax TaxID=2251 RepID=A0A6G1Z4Y1_9EURY|nr:MULTISPECIES: DUF4097 family beta strand repeat-containing protein [Haloferax]KAB1188899.1 DUF4097 family beta strand repeat protein [Haloferax sp. CBA1149]MRW81619.1 DUF4097 family beta strand repeat protein [Haloferax marinisediminis]